MAENHQKPPEKPDSAPPTRYGQPVYASNPTIPAPGTISKARRKQIGNEKKGIVFDDGGELISHGVATIYQFEEVDKERFVKLYLAGLKSAVGMSKAGLEVFQVVYDQMREHKERDYVLLSALDAKLNERTFQRGLRELISRQFLYRATVPGMFWVNIQYMFNGDRLAFVKAYQIKGSAEQLSLLPALEGEEKTE